jgi:hypothetical protein
MESLAREFPIPISWKETQRIKQILAERNQGPPTPFAVVLIDSQPFKRITAGTVETANNLQECAAFEDQDVAFVVAKVLQDLGHTGIRITTITNQRRAPGDFVNTLAEVGFVSQ